MDGAPGTGGRGVISKVVVGLTLVGLLLAGALAVFAVRLQAAQRESERGAEQRFAERAQISAALTQAVFGALGTASQEQLARQFSGSPAAVRRRLHVEMKGTKAVYTAIHDASGRILAGVGRQPERAPSANPRPGQAVLSGLRRSARGPLVEFAVSFASPSGDRVLVEGLPLPMLRVFLVDYLSRLPDSDGTALRVVDEHDKLIARTGPTLAALSGSPAVNAAAALPGTTWQLRMAAPRARVLAHVNKGAWLAWGLLGVLAVALCVGLWLCGRVLLGARRIRDANAALRDSEGRLRGLVDALEEAVLVAHADGRVELLNSSARRLFATDADVLEAPLGSVAMLSDDGAPLADDELPYAIALHTGEPQCQVVGMRRADGSSSWLEVSARPLSQPDGQAPYAAVCSCTDVTERHELEAHLLDLADRDPLTGLWNRRRFEADVAQQLARCQRYDEQAAVLLLDVDGFKEINDTLGHLAGDDVLRALGEALASRLRSTDCAARFGGDEFAVLLHQVRDLDAERIATDMTERLSLAAEEVGSGVPLSISAGVAMLDRHSGSIGEVLGAADRAMYALKQERADDRRRDGARLEPRRWAPTAAAASVSALTVLRDFVGADVAWLARDSGDGGAQIVAVTDGVDELGLVRGRVLYESTPLDPAASYATVSVSDADGVACGSLCVARLDGQLRFGERERELAQALAIVAAGQLQHDELIKADTELASLRALLAAVNARDSYTAVHSRQVVTLARSVARRLGLDAVTISEVEHVALLHDLGKIAVPDSILRKPGPLTEHEQLLMRRHPVVGAEILASTPELAYLAPAVRAEHERWDGTGYPNGLAGDAIPIASRIAFVCDAYHAMTSDRPYRRAMSSDAARAEIRKQAGTQFCPRAAAALLAVLADADAASA